MASRDESKNATGMSGEPRRRSLFTKVGGGPMCFSLTACPERNEIRELIERGGGVLLHPDTMRGEIRLVPSSTTAVTDSGDDVFSVDCIRACSEKNRLCPREDFKVPKPPIVPNDSKKKTPRPVRLRREYTLAEDIAIARFIAKQPGVRVKGNAVYKEMAAAGIVPGKHPWQSLRQRYLKVILPMRQLYESPASSLPAREPKKVGGISRCDTPAQHDLVEDSQDNSPKRKGQAAHELENFDGSNTTAEVVAESPATPLGTPARKETKDGKRKRRNRISGSSSLVPSSCERSSNTQGTLRNGGEQKAGRKLGNDIKSSSDYQDFCEDPTGKLNLQTSLLLARKRTPKRPSGNRAEAQARQGIDSSAERTTYYKTVVGPLPAHSNKQQTLPTTPKASKKGAQVHARRDEIDTDYEFEVSPGFIKRTTQGTRHRAHCSDRLKKQDSWQSLSGQLDHTPSPGNTHRPTQLPERKRGRRKLVDNSIVQSSTCPKSRSNNADAREADFENPPAVVCVAEELQLATVPSLGGCKKKGVPSPCKSREEQALLLKEQAMPPRGRRNSSCRRLREIRTSSTKGSDGVPNVDSSVTSMLYLSSAPKHRLPSSPPKERKRGTAPADHGSHSSSLPHLESEPPEADLGNPVGCTRASENSELQQTMKLPRRPEKRGMSSRYGQSKMTERASAVERDIETLMGTVTSSLVRKPDVLASSVKGSDRVLSDAESSATDALNSTCSPECIPSQCRSLRHLWPSPGKRGVGTSPTTPNSSLSADPCLEASVNDGTSVKTNSEDPLQLFYAVKGPLLQATLLREHSKANGVLSQREGSSKEMACLHKSRSSTRAKASAHRKQTRLSRPAEQGGTELGIIAMDNEKEPDAGHFDSADELLFQWSTRQAPESPISLDSADENPVARVSSPCSNNASVITTESSSECSAHQDGFSQEHQELARLLAFLKERKQQPPHALGACPLGCGCPHSTSYIRAGRTAVALSASLAYHDSPLPGDCPKDPKIALLLEVLLRRLEGGDSENASS